MTEREVFEKIDDFLKENTKGVPFDKALPIVQEFVWKLGDLIGITGPEVMRIYFEMKSKEIKNKND